jgi:Thrombospondin type 3 repeat
MLGSRRLAVWLVSVSAALLWAGPALAASADFGRTASSNATTFATAGTGVQDLVEAGGPSYTAPFDGVITSWRTFAAASGGPVELKVFRRTAPGQYLTVAESGEETGGANQENSFDTAVSVQAGDLLGLRWSNNYRVKSGTSGQDHLDLQSDADPSPGSPFAPLSSSAGFLNVATTIETDNDLDGAGDDTQDVDDDNDGVIDGSDNCALTANRSQVDTDGAADGGDACDPDDDNDGAADSSDNCVTVANTGQENADGDAQGDSCDPDDDNDGLTDGSEEALGTNPFSGDTDADGTADASDSCPKIASGDAGGCPDLRPPGLAVRAVPRRLTRRAFLRGVTATLLPDEPSAFELELRGTARGATLARSFNVILARRTLSLGSGERAVRLKPQRRLVGRARRLAAQLTITATDAAGNRTTMRRTIRVR